jgi:hypothetical protein
MRERRLDTVGSGYGPVAGCCEYGDEPSGSVATELVSYAKNIVFSGMALCNLIVDRRFRSSSMRLRCTVSQKGFTFIFFVIKT